MIVINLKGGLGNQLFQIYNGLSLSIEYSIDLKINDSYYKKKSKDTPRNTYWNNFLSEINNIVVSKDFKFKIIKEKGFKFNKIILNQKNSVLNGYYQSYKYFLYNFEKINNLLNIKQKRDLLRKRFKNVYDFYQLGSIHFRYGDYKGKGDFHLNLDKEYFLKAIKQCNCNDFLIFYEEEDEILIKNIIKDLDIGGKIYYIDHQIVDYDQMLMMSLCKNNIIANSSFSWWGAYFNDNIDKVVVRPSKWFVGKGNKINIEDLCPKEWKVISV